MKKQRYIVEIEMPDGDFIHAGWLKDLIQAVCDVEDESRQKVTVQEITLTSNLDEAAEEYSGRFQDEKDKLYAFHGFRDGAMWRGSQAQRLSNDIDRAAELSANDAMIKRQFPSVVYNTGLNCFNHSDLIKQFKAGAEWMAGQGETHELTVESPVIGPPMICCPVHADNGDKVVVQIRKK